MIAELESGALGWHLELGKWGAARECGAGAAWWEGPSSLGEAYRDAGTD